MSNRILIYLLIALSIFFLWTILFPPPKPKLDKQVNIKIDIPIADSLISFENDLYKVQISRKGGFITSFYVKKYKTELLGNYPIFIFKNLKDKSFNYKISQNQIILFSNGDSIIYRFKKNYLVEVISSDSEIISYGIAHNVQNSYEKRYASLLYYQDKWHNIHEDKLFLPYEIKSAQFLGSRTQYFLFLILNPTSSSKGFLYDSRIIIETKLNNSFSFYLGPIDPQILKSIDKKLEIIYDWGFFLIAPFSQLIFYSFRFFYSFIHNYGFVIILFALIIKLIFSPLSYISYKSLQKLAKIQPQIQKLQVIYKDDPEKLQKEILRIYQEEKVNPFSGCLPLFIQLPIFFALYQVLVTSIDFKNAEFIFWIKDLSSKDPYFILPILMTLISLLNTLIQPTTDKNAKTIGIIMSLVFLIIFITFPAGLVLYWLSYSLFSVVEQFIFKKFILKGGK
ncbi:MAG: membrane protein insertase YidC [candidate division WOR-3 bacterium]|jgi:YidC/Oxa1 family membrane protein insertase